METERLPQRFTVPGPSRRRSPRHATLAAAGVLTATALVAVAPSATVHAATTPTAACREVAGLSTRALAARTLMLGVDSATPDASRAIVATIKPGGIMIRDKTGANLKRSLATITGGAGPLLVAVDEEGGRVQRLRTTLGVIPSARVLGATQTPEQTRTLIAKHAARMRDLGFNVDFAPVADLTDATSGVISDRSFSADAEKTTTFVRAYSEGLLDSGVLPVIKHFPGHGRASGDSHQLLPTTPSWASLQALDVLPFQRVLSGLGGRPALMMGHLAVPGLSGKEPATISPAAVSAGKALSPSLVFTDDLGMGAITAGGRTPGQAAEAALRAGNDVALFAWEKAPSKIVDHLTAAMARDAGFAARVGDAACRVTRTAARLSSPGTTAATVSPSETTVPVPAPSKVAPAPIGVRATSATTATTA